MKVILKTQNNIFGSLLLLCEALFFFAMGIFCLVQMRDSLEMLLIIITFVLFCAGVVFIGSFILIPHKRMASTLVSGIIYTVLGLLLWLFPQFMLGMIVYLIGAWMLINFIWRFALCVQLKANADSGFWRAVIDCAISLVFSVLTFVFPAQSGKAIHIILGIYLLMYGLTLFGDFLRELLKWDLQGKYIKRRIKLRIPVLLTAFLPTQIFNKINENLNDKTGTQVQIIKEQEKYLDTKLEIFVHMSPKIAYGFGHVDVCYNGTVYSYGTYDADSIRCFGTVSDGVFVEMPRDRYIQHCLNVDNERIVGYSVYLTEDKLSAMAGFIVQFKENVYEWKSKEQLSPGGGFKDPASVFYREIGARFYKFKSGKFKTYFAVKTNCVQLADLLVGSSGIDVISLNGIITPGTYLKYLDDCFNRKNSFIVKKTVLSGTVNK